MKRLGLLGGMSWESSVEYGATDQRAGTGADGRCRVSRSLIHIADVTAAAVRAERVTAVAVLVTRYTMEQDFYVRRLREMHGLTVLVPDEPDRTAVHNVIYDELVRGVTDGASRQRYLEVIARLQARGADGLIAA
ncbi:MAG: aspartate/glutamate racemase family protein, partial [Mycobacterium leprae]